MVLQISVVPASTQAGKATIEVLLADPGRPIINAVYRNPSKAPAELTKHERFRAVKGDVGEASSLSFQDSEAVFYIPPPIYDGTTDTAEFATTTGENIKAALEKASSVKRLLLFSALGAENASGIGTLCINHISEQILQHQVSEVVIVRPGYFQEMFAEALQTSQPKITSFFTPADFRIPMVALPDISRICASVLLDTGSKLRPNPHIFELHGPRSYSTNDVQHAFEQVTGQKAKVELIEQDQLKAFFARLVGEKYSEEMTEFTLAALPGGIIADKFEMSDSMVRGKIELVDNLQRILDATRARGAS